MRSSPLVPALAPSRHQFAYPRAFIALAFLAAVGAVFAIAWTYLPFVTDDSLISFRYSERLLAGHGLTFTPGDRVEGYSNLLWVLAVAAGGLLTPDLILVGRVLGLCGAALALAAIVWAASTMAEASVCATLAALAALAFSHGLAIWAIGGLEASLLVCLLAWTLGLLVRARASDDVPVTVSVLLALLVLTRPDGALFPALVGIGLLIVHGLSAATLRTIARVLALPAVAWCGQLAFRLVYYGDWLPNTAHIKLAWSMIRVTNGAQYIEGGLWTHGPITLIALVGVVSARPFRRRDVVIPLVVGLGYGTYVLLVGGDFFPGQRQFLPVLVCLAMLVLTTWRRGLIGRRSLLLQAATLAIACAVYLQMQRTDPANLRASTERWEWRCAAVATELRLAFAAREPLIATDPIGCVGYFGKLPTLDLLGLTDRHIAKTRPPYLGEGIPGHEFGDGWYVLSRKPDIVLLCLPEGSEVGCFKSGIELARAREFKQEYVLVPVSVGTGFVSKLWFRTSSERIGVVRSGGEVRVPGFLFGAGGAAPVRLSAANRFVTQVPAGATVHFTQIALEPGPWVARAVATAPVDAVVDDAGIRVTAGAVPSDLVEVVLTRDPAAGVTDVRATTKRSASD